MYISTTLEKVIISIMAFIMMVLIALNIFPSEVSHLYYDYIEPIKNEEFHKISDEHNVYLEVETTSEIESQINWYVNYTLKKAPLYKNDYYIIFTGHDIETNVAYAKGFGAAGVTNNREKKIYINYLHIEFAFLHEVGHAVDNTYGFSKTEEFEALYKKVKPEDTDYIPTNIDEYMLLDIAEYFAENYRKYVVGTLEDTELLEYFNTITKDIA